MHCNVTTDGTFGGYIPQLLIMYSEMQLKNFDMSVFGGYIQQLLILNSEMKDLH